MTTRQQTRPPYTVTREGEGRHRAGHVWTLRVDGTYAGTYETRRQAREAYDAAHPHLTACEVHDAPGECSQECLALAQRMDADPLGGVTEDPTGTSYRPQDYATPATALVLQGRTVVRRHYATDRDETDACQAGTPGCAIDHAADRGACEGW